MSPATVATRPMHAPACETMPAVAEYYGRGGANKTSNKYSSFPSRTPSSSSSSSSSLPLPSTVVRYTTRPSSSSSSAPPLSLAAAAAYPMYPGLQTAAAATPNSSSSSMSSTTNTAAGTAPISSLARRRGQNPSPLNRPRKISNTNNARDGGPSATVLRHLPCRPRQQEPNELFRTLPAEVLAGVLAQLRWLHLGPGATSSCATCLARDLCSLSLASRAWCAAAQPALYRCVCLVGAETSGAAQQQRKRFRRGGSSSSSSGGVCIRMTLLRRTLRANDRLAAMVRELQVPAPPGDAPTTPIGLARNNDHENAVAALVMACPNLEVLAGPLAATYTHHEFSRVTHALATRTQLRTINWRIGASDDPPSGSDPVGGSSCFARGGGSGGGVFSSALTAPQETRFLEHHRGWPCLASLSIHCLPGSSLATLLLPRALTCLPALQHLHLCALPRSAFSDATLLALPALQSLTLSHMPGVSAAGLSALATRPNSRTLRRLQLRHTALTSLPALARLLSHLPALEAFALVQHVAPLMPRDEGGAGGAFALWMMPYLASRTLVRLHWDVVAAGAGVSDADDILARSIAAGGFPALRTLRAPNDPEGIFQQLCRPLESIATSADRIWANGGRSGSSHGQQQRRSGSVDSGLLPASRFGGLPKSATATSLPTGSSSSLTGVPPPHATDLRGARIAAQARLEDARPRFRFRVQVHSDEGGMVEEFGLGGYMGTVDSPVRYCLEPDPGSSDARGGLVDVPDLAAAPPEEEDDDGVAALGCTGSWNWREGVVVADRKEKESWWHAERPRWVRPRLDNGEDIRHAARTAMTNKEKNTIPELRIPMV
ncbi:F-box domain [Cordyceps militaris]|uniref:F-box domain n=1 Tax=Cordyceps militaris TaxID=73501 RepID=A0A2H4S7A7_CORMI|nr:F-box domain [Cordyceps militaris]